MPVWSTWPSKLAAPEYSSSDSAPVLGVETRSGISPGRPVVTASAAHEAGDTADICGF